MKGIGLLASEQILWAWAMNICHNEGWGVKALPPFSGNHSPTHPNSWTIQRRRRKFIPIISKMRATIHWAFTICLAQCLPIRAIYENSMWQDNTKLTVSCAQSCSFISKEWEDVSISLPTKEPRHCVLKPRFLLLSGKSCMALIYEGLNHKWKLRDLSFHILFGLKNVLREFELDVHI